MKKILLIYTGGTIGMQENPETNALESVDFDRVLPMIAELKRFCLQIDTIKFDPPMDSSDMDPKQWSRLVEIIDGHYDEYFGFVILHGTDTMAYTASALSFMLEGLAKPVILTGSQLPIGKIRTDGRENLTTAIEIASAENEMGEPRVPEVCIFFHDKLLRGNRTTKSSADQFDAFESFNFPPLATSAVDITYNENLIHKPNEVDRFIPHYNMDTNIIVLSLFPGIREEMVRSMLEIEGLKGVVMRTFGSGNAPQQPWLTELLKNANNKGIVIINITQCAGGYVVMNRYGTGLHLEQAGVVSGHDSTVESALTKMMMLFGEGLTPKQVREKLTLSLAGDL